MLTAALALILAGHEHNDSGPMEVDPGFVQRTWAMSDGDLVVRQLIVGLDWVPSDSEYEVVCDLMRGFNDRLYDATDGQIRVQEFVIAIGPTYSEPDQHALMEGPGSVHIHRRWEGPIGEPGREHEHSASAAGLGHGNGRPAAPMHAHLGYEFIERMGADSYAGAALMEFLHSWTGLLDEYEIQPGDSCLPDAWSCAMHDPINRRELCRPGAHSGANEQHRARGADCWTWLAHVVQQDLGVTMSVPNQPVGGPATAPLASYRRVEGTSHDTTSGHDDPPAFLSWQGSIAGSTPYYSADFELVAGQVYVIETTDLSTGCDTVIQLRVSTDTRQAFDTDPVVAEDDDSGGNLSSRIEWTCTQTGAYYVQVRAYNEGGAGTFSLWVRGGEHTGEHGHEEGEADGPLSWWGELTSEYSWVSSDFSLLEGHTYVFETSDLSEGCDTVLQLRGSTDPNQAFDTDPQIAEDDDGAGGYASRITWTCTQSGVYYLRAHAYGGNAVGTFRCTAYEAP